MADTYTAVLGITKPGQGDYFNAWHTPANLVFEMLADSIAGETALALTGDTTLTTTNGTDDSGRAYIIRVSSSDQHDRVITVPAASKTYLLVNDSDKRVKIKPSGGTATDVLPATEAVIRVTSTKAVRTATSGWGLHSNTTTTSGASQTIALTGLGQHFNDIRLVFKLVDLTAGNLTVQLRTDAASGGTALSTGIGGGVTMGQLSLDGYRADYGSYDVRLAGTAASPVQQAANTYQAQWRVTGGVGSIVLGITAGSFAGGSVDCWLR